MKAACLHRGEISIQEVPNPKPKQGQLLVAPVFTGICGSDLHVQHMQKLNAAANSCELAPTVIPGHEFSAQVVQVGPNTVTDHQEGDYVIAMPFQAHEDGHIIIGISELFSGGIAELSLIQAQTCLPVPQGLALDLAALTEPLAVGIHAANKVRSKQGPFVVIGCGPVGLSVILALKSQGLGPVVASDLSASRRAMAEKLGADVVIDPKQASPLEQWDSLGFRQLPISPLLSKGFSRDIPAPTLFDCVGARGMMADLMSHAPNHSHIVVVGVCPHEDSFVPVLPLFKELSVSYILGYSPEAFAHALQITQSHGHLVKHMITSKVRLSDTHDAFYRLSSQPDEVKILINPCQL